MLSLTHSIGEQIRCLKLFSLKLVSDYLKARLYSVRVGLAKLLHLVVTGGFCEASLEC